MTVNSTIRKTSPFIGNDVTTQLPFAFMVFVADDILVTSVDDETGVETVLSLNTDYTVSLNQGQASNPGGTVTLKSPIETGTTIVVSSQVLPLQKTDITNAGGFYPNVIEAALDRQMIVAQQLKEELDRCAKVPITSAVSDMEKITDNIVRLADSVDNIDTVVSNLSAINTVASDLNEPVSEIEVVAGSIANVDAVGTNISKVKTVADDVANIDAVAANKTNIDAVAGNIQHVVGANTNKANIDAVVANKANIDAVAANKANIDAAPGAAASAATSADQAAQSVISAANASRLTVGSVVTGAAGSSASANITGAAGSQSLNLVVPRGEKGERGESAVGDLLVNLNDPPIGQIFFVKTIDRTNTAVAIYDVDGVTKVCNLFSVTQAVAQALSVAKNWCFHNGAPVYTGSSKVDSLYVGEFAYVNATGALGGIDNIYLPRAYADYASKTVSANGFSTDIYAISESGIKHGAIVTNGTSTAYDVAHFADGGCTTYALKLALQAGTDPVLDPALATPATVPSDAIDIRFTVHNNWLRCYGQTVNTADYPTLAKAWGVTDATFTLPAIESSDISIANPINADLMAFVVGA